MCREPLSDRLPAVNVVLRGVIEKLYPEEYLERVEEGKREEEERELAEAAALRRTEAAAEIDRARRQSNNGLRAVFCLQSISILLCSEQSVDDDERHGQSRREDRSVDTDTDDEIRVGQVM